MRGVGIDIVDVARFENRIANQKFLDLVFTLAEQRECLAKGNIAECLAARFAAKEAYMKSIGTGWSSEAQFHEIEIAKSENGQPKIVLHNAAKTYFKENGYLETHLTISHNGNTAVAVVIAL